MNTKFPVKVGRAKGSNRKRSEGPENKLIDVHDSDMEARQKADISRDIRANIHAYRTGARHCGKRVGYTHRSGAVVVRFRASDDPIQKLQRPKEVEGNVAWLGKENWAFARRFGQHSIAHCFRGATHDLHRSSGGGQLLAELIEVGLLRWRNKIHRVTLPIRIMYHPHT